jgi:hypothetical protein
MLADKARGIYGRGGSTSTRKHKTRLEKLAMEKGYSLLAPLSVTVKRFLKD